ncbi:lipoprotein [Bordetella pertussis]|nr:lipoprotein [Bordetella pertussis]
MAWAAELAPANAKVLGNLALLLLVEGDYAGAVAQAAGREAMVMPVLQRPVMDRFGNPPLLQ